MNMLLEFGRKLVATNSLDLILATTVRTATELVPGSFCKVLMLDDAGNFICRATYPTRYTRQNAAREGKPNRSFRRQFITKFFNRACRC